MACERIIGIMGGDTRQCFMAGIMVEKGYEVYAYGLKAEQLHPEVKQAASLKELLERAHIIVGPVPFVRNGEQICSQTVPEDLTLENFKGYVQERSCLFAGRLPKDLMAYLKENGIAAYDFMENQGLAIFNTIATAEGAIAEAIIRHPGNIHHSPCLILGYGKCAKTLADKLKGLSGEVTVAARKESDLHVAQTLGYRAMRFSDLEEQIGRYTYIFNTVPEVVLPESILARMDAGAIVIDIASMPGGADYVAVKRHSYPVYHCLSLPGKYAPKASANSLVDLLESWLVQPATPCF